MSEKVKTALQSILARLESGDITKPATPKRLLDATQYTDLKVFSVLKKIPAGPMPS